MAHRCDKAARAREAAKMADLHERCKLPLGAIAERFGTTKATVRLRLREASAIIEGAGDGEQALQRV